MTIWKSAIAIAHLSFITTLANAQQHICKKEIPDSTPIEEINWIMDRDPPTDYRSEFKENDPFVMNTELVGDSEYETQIGTMFGRKFPDLQAMTFVPVKRNYFIDRIPVDWDIDTAEGLWTIAQTILAGKFHYMVAVGNIPDKLNDKKLVPTLALFVPSKPSKEDKCRRFAIVLVKLTEVPKIYQLQPDAIQTGETPVEPPQTAGNKAKQGGVIHGRQD